MPLPLDIAGLSALYVAGETIIFPHGHASRLWRSQLAKQFPASHLILPLAWSEWTSQLWSNLMLEGVDDRLLLNRLQELQVWTAILQIHSPEAAVSGASLRDLAELARSGLQRAAAYRIVDRLRSSADSPDTRAFALWCHAFHDRCKRDRLLAPALLEEVLASHIGEGLQDLPKNLHLVGFERVTPAQDHLLVVLEASGTVVHHHPLRQIAEGSREAAEFPDERQQLRFAVRLVAESARSPRDGSPRFALICRDPQEYQPELERLFRELLAPELSSVFADLSSAPWYFTAAAPLRTVPAIADALDLLRWTVSPLSMERIGQLVVSPFHSVGDSQEARARFDVSSTREVPALRGALDLSAFITLLPKASRSKLHQASFAELRSLVESARAAALDYAEHSASEWCEQIRKLLLTVGWPGSRKLSPFEYQVTQAWESLLDNLSTLQFDGSRMRFSDLLDLLSAEASHLPAPALNRDVPVQVLSLAEADGLFFDLAIHLDATDKNLPNPERRHPLLSQRLQRSLGIGDAAGALRQTKDLLESLVDRSASVYLLAAQDPAEGKAQLTSIAADLHFRRRDAEEYLPGEDLTPPVATEPIDDPQKLPLVTRGQVHGGVDILSAQAACGFRAFATHRLQATQASGRNLGVDPREAGSLLHDALEFLWQRIGNSADLGALSPEHRRERVKEAVQQAFTHRKVYPPAKDAWAERYLRILQRRFTSLLTRWLEEHELQRSPFTVLAREQEQTLALGPLRLKIRPDRIDEVVGGQVFVDYKTSFDLSSKHWLEERLEAPQLPAYALAADPDQIKGISFAQIRPGEKMGWISLSEHAGLFPKKQNKSVIFSEQLGIWHDQLTALAVAFAEGDARVNPKKYPHTCQYCAHRTLCRLDPESLLEEADDADELVEEDALG